MQVNLEAEMIKEYHFASFVFNERSNAVHCTYCGKEIKAGANVAKVHGRWVCVECIVKDVLPHSEITPVDILLDAATR